MSDNVPQLAQKKWIITETFKDDGSSEVAATPANWIKKEILFWPRSLSQKAMSINLQECVEPTKRWMKFTKFKILENGGTYGKFM